MKLEFLGTYEELKWFKKQFPELLKYVVYTGDGIQHNKEYAAQEEQIKKDIEDMRYMRDKLIFTMDRAIKRIPDDK